MQLFCRKRAPGRIPATVSLAGAPNVSMARNLIKLAPGENRTHNHLLRRQMLYPLSYGRMKESGRRDFPPLLLRRSANVLVAENPGPVARLRATALMDTAGSGRRDLNPGPPAPKAGALPTALRPGPAVPWTQLRYAPSNP